MSVRRWLQFYRLSLFALLTLLVACTHSRSTDVYRDPKMDFGVIDTLAVMPFAGLTRDNIAAERVRDVFINKLLATGGVYVLPVGEVARGVLRTEIPNPSAPSPEEVIKLGTIIKVPAILTGVVREYGEVRSGTTSANIISLSVEMMETQTGRVVWATSSTKGGVNIWDRLFGGGGRPMADVTEQAVNDVINKLFR